MSHVSATTKPCRTRGVMAMRLQDIDLIDPGVFTRGVPHEWFTYLRATEPVWRHPEPDGPGFWVVTKQEDVISVANDSGLYPSDMMRGGVVGLEEPPPEQRAQMEAAAAAGVGKMMLMMDPPDHTRYRKLVNRGFTPRQIRSLEPVLRSMAVRIVEGASAKGDVDFVVDVAAELPLQAIAELIGVPQEDRHKIFEWSNRMIGSDDAEYNTSPEEAQLASMELFAYAEALAAERRADPRDDIATV